MVEQLYQWASKLLFAVAGGLLFLLALLLFAMAAWDVAGTVGAGEPITATVLHGIGLVVIGIAVFEVSRFLIEEEVLRERELRSSSEARKSLTKFITIIIIAVSLEALVMVFEVGERSLPELVYPVLLLSSAIAALVGLSLFQLLSRRSEESASRTHQIDAKTDDTVQHEELEAPLKYQRDV